MAPHEQRGFFPFSLPLRSTSTSHPQTGLVQCQRSSDFMRMAAPYSAQGFLGPTPKDRNYILMVNTRQVYCIDFFLLSCDMQGGPRAFSGNLCYVNQMRLYTKGEIPTPLVCRKS